VRVCDDLAGAWFMWTLREAAARTGHMGSAPEADAFFQRIADELARARERGELAPARVTVPPLHPYPGTYLGHLGSSFRRVARRMAMPGDPPDWDPPRDDPSTPAPVVALFDEVATRRSELAKPSPVVIEGGAVSALDGIERVSLERAGWRGANPADTPRPRVEIGSVALRGGPREQLRFRFEVAKVTGAFRSMDPTLVVERESGVTSRMSLPEAGRWAERGGVRVAVDTVREDGAGSAARRRIRQALWRAHALLIRVLTPLGAVAAVVLLLPPWRGRRWDRVDLALGLVAVAVVSRVAMLTAVDASTLPAWSSRYVYPVVSLADCGLLLLLFAALRHRRLRTSFAPGGTAPSDGPGPAGSG
jgi:hypothetical protein